MASTGSESTEELATAVGRYVLGEQSLGRAAETAGLSRWEFEEILEESGFTALYGSRTEEDLQRELDAARDLGE